jgi:hypothetical protein
LAPVFSFSQKFIGLNEEEINYHIKTTLKNEINDITRTYSSDGTLIIGWNNFKLDYFQALYFDKKGIVQVESKKPDSNDILNTMIKVYDKNCIKISSTEWKYYLRGAIYRIRLQYVDEYGYYIYTSLWD